MDTQTPLPRPRLTGLLLALLAALCVSLATLPSRSSAGSRIVPPNPSIEPFQQWVDAAKVPTPTTTVKVLWKDCLTAEIIAAVWPAASLAHVDVATLD